MISEEELDLLRAEQLKYLPGTEGVIKRVSYLGGDQLSAPDTIASGLSYRLLPGFGLWREVADRFQGVTAFTITLPYGTDLKASDIFIDDGSLTFQVRDVLAPKGYSTAVRALLDLVTD
jgi:hypothetical protein